MGGCRAYNIPIPLVEAKLWLLFGKLWDPSFYMALELKKKAVNFLKSNSYLPLKLKFPPPRLLRNVVLYPVVCFGPFLL